MNEKKLTLGILINTMNEGIERVKEKLLPQLTHVDEIIISHQITDERTPEKEKLGKKVKYVYMYDKGLCKNRNNLLKHATADICHICDDDLHFVPGFEEDILRVYERNHSDVVTFQAVDELGKPHYYKKDGKHSVFSIGKIPIRGITFMRKSIINNNIWFDENFGLGTKRDTGDEPIFLKNCRDKGLSLIHRNIPIVIHPSESSGIVYRKSLIIARIKVFKRMY
ncbi:MAG: glycosyltransferase family 2 protein [Candidatus Peribacteria bacterium]|jgi:glycosyltransferase involved in cell wall biosynthesis|nr:glycosyltransferase family 2 protein [Candidatus Peribacteria bacterium]